MYSFEKKRLIGPAIRCEVIESGPLRAAIALEYPPTAAGSLIRQIISLKAESSRLDFRTEVDWKESRKLLRAVFATSVRAPQASYGTQFGYVTRPTSFNTSWDRAKFEVCGHQYADISEYGFGVSLLSDYKYGFSVRDSVMRLSLLRSPKSPDEGADMGKHVFTYSVLPHWRAFPCRAVLAEAMDMNFAPTPYMCSGSIRKSQGALVGVKKGGLDSVVISAVKMAEHRDDAIVIRAYESLGGRGKAYIRVGASSCQEVVACNLLEDEKMCSRDTDANCPTDAKLRGGNEIEMTFSAFQVRTVMVILQ